MRCEQVGTVQDGILVDKKDLYDAVVNDSSIKIQLQLKYYDLFTNIWLCKCEMKDRSRLAHSAAKKSMY